MNLRYFFAAQIFIFAAAVYAAVVTCDNKGLYSIKIDFRPFKTFAQIF